MEKINDNINIVHNVNNHL